MLRKNLIYLFVLLLASSCKKEPAFITDPSIKLSFSRDTVLFDTVFTSVGSTTQRLKIYNPAKKPIRVSNIKLAGAPNSAYQININGLAVSELSNLELGGRDSASIFIRVTINPNAENQPFVVQDSITFLTNGNRQVVHLRAYGQNAHFVNGESLTGDVIWTKTLPYVIYNTVAVTPDAKLTIEEGCKLYFHKDAKLAVAGTLHIRGNVNEPVMLMSDRLEQIYEEEPGQWSGIIFTPQSEDNRINYAVIKNAVAGLQVQGTSENKNPQLILSNTIIKNMEVAALTAHNSNLKLFNNLFYTCGQYLIYATEGGSYDLKQNTFAAYNFSFARQTPALYFSDSKTGSTDSHPLNIWLYNNIIWGSLNDELAIAKKGTSVTLKAFTNVIRTGDGSLNVNGNILNTDPLFQDAKEQNYRLTSGSQAINKGTDLSFDPYFASFLSKDLKQNERIFPSVLGSYQLF